MRPYTELYHLLLQTQQTGKSINAPVQVICLRSSSSEEDFGFYPRETDEIRTF